MGYSFALPIRYSLLISQYEGNATGVYNLEMAIDRVKNVGKRSYAASTYYNISVDRPNLTVYLTTQVRKREKVSGSLTATLHRLRKSTSLVMRNRRTYGRVA